MTKGKEQLQISYIHHSIFYLFLSPGKAEELLRGQPAFTDIQGITEDLAAVTSDSAASSKHLQPSKQAKTWINNLRW